MRGGAAPPPKRRYAYVSFAAGRNCVIAMISLGLVNEVDIFIYNLRMVNSIVP